jgi:hypothetical protein
MFNRQNSLEISGEISIKNNHYRIELSNTVEKNYLFDKFEFESEAYLLAIEGFFYQDMEKEMLKSRIGKVSIDEFVNNLNGSFIGIYIDKEKLSVNVFTDTYGYNKLYYSVNNGTFTFSTRFWKLLEQSQQDLTINQNSIAEHLILGHPLHNRTLVDEVSLIPPGYIASFGSDCKMNLKQRIKTPEKRTAKKSRLISDFLSVAENHFTYVRNKSNSDLLGVSLTGGGDTRVILNAALNTGLQIKTFTGYDKRSSITLREKERTNQIAQQLQLDHADILMSGYTEELMKDVLNISDGYKSGHWMASLAVGAREYTNNVYYGFDADVLSGSAEVNLNRIKTIKELSEETLHLKSYYHTIKLEDLIGITDVSYTAFLENYMRTFDDYKDNPMEDIYYFQEKNVRSFRRIASFADGSKLGATPVNFFHDANVIKFYRELPDNYLREERFHHIIGGYKNKTLSKIPSANNLPVPHKYIPFFKKYFNSPVFKAMYLKLKNRNKQPNMVHMDVKSELEKHIQNTFLLKPQSLAVLFEYIDEKRLQDLLNKGMTQSDLSTMLSRIFELDYVITRVKNKEYV